MKEFKKLLVLCSHTSISPYTTWHLLYAESDHA